MRAQFEKTLWVTLTLVIYALMGTLLLAALLISVPILLVVLCLDVNSFYRTLGYFRSRKDSGMLLSNTAKN